VGGDRKGLESGLGGRVTHRLRLMHWDVAALDVATCLITLFLSRRWIHLATLRHINTPRVAISEHGITSAVMARHAD
jgi:hypothetical protein